MALPLKLKVALRDVWNKDDGQVQQTFAKLKTVLGYPVSIEPEWPLLWAELQREFPDTGTFVPTIAQLVVDWCRILTDLLEKEVDPSWTDQLLEKVGRTQILKLALEIGDGVSTSWNDTTDSFAIRLPKSNNLEALSAHFPEDLSHAFNPSSRKPSQLPPLHADDESVEVVNSDFDVMSIATPETSGRQIASHPQRADVLPNVQTLPRPEDLLKRAPYHLILYNISAGKEVAVECSHEASLELIFDYFKRWVKTNHNKTTKPPAAIITLRESCFGLGILHDRLHLELDTYNHRQGLSPTLLIAFIEGVLGYRMTFNDSSTWTFRRDTPFK